MNAEQATYRYVRFALLMVLVALTVSVTAETVRVGWQHSLSAYYYTAAGPIFVAALTAIGLCLVVLRGATDAEEVCLNLAGLSAPMVAFVPTPQSDEPIDNHAILNNAGTFFAMLAVGFVVIVGYGISRRVRGVERWPSPWVVIGLVSTVLAWLVGVTWILSDQDSFAHYAHYMAAVFTFVPFAGVVLLNTRWGIRVLARDPAAESRRFEKTYDAITAGIALITLAGLALRHWAYALLATEIGLLTLFALFWVLQTIDQLPIPGHRHSRSR